MNYINKRNVSYVSRLGLGEYIVHTYNPSYKIYVSSPPMKYMYAVFCVAENKKKWNTKKQKFN